MKSQFLIFLSFILNVFIFFQVPKDVIGLSSFTPNNELLGSPTTAEKLIKILTIIIILIYIFLMFELNKIV